MNRPVRRPCALPMLAQNAAVLPLPFDPVTTTERRSSHSRSTARHSSSAANRARQMPSPYFGSSNTKAVPSRKKCDARFSGSGRLDRILPIAGSTDWSSPRSPLSPPVAPDIREQVHGGDPKPERADGFPCLRRSGRGWPGLENHRSASAQVHPPRKFQALPLGNTRSSAGSLAGLTAGESPRDQQRGHCAAARDRGSNARHRPAQQADICTPHKYIVIQQKDAVFVPRTSGCIRIES